MEYLPKDFVATHDGLLFAVLAVGVEQGRVIGVLRYRSTNEGLRKLSTSQADLHLQQHHPSYQIHCPIRDADVHAVPVQDVVRHLRPRARVEALRERRSSTDACEHQLLDLVDLFASNGVPSSAIGVTGSLLVGAAHSHSDIDLVVYDRQLFHGMRKAIARLTDTGQLAAFTESDWHRAYDRRGCSLSFDEYVWHERRKANKGMIQGTKFDLSLVDPETARETQRWEKLGEFEGTLRIVDDRLAFDSPARWRIDNSRISELVSHTATYVGQAQSGERVVAAGLLEQSPERICRLVVGTSREAAGQFIRVLR